MEARIGFVGLGVMGQPMALNLQRSGIDLIVWNRTPQRCAPLVAAGARQAATIDEVFATGDIIILMLANERATDAVLGRGEANFAPRVAGKRLIMMGTASPEWSERLARDVEQAGGIYIEAPVSGSRQPAIDAKLVAMVAGPSEAVRTEAARLIAPMCGQTFDAGSVPNGLRLKISVNLFLITMVTGLAETAALARRLGVDWALLSAVLDAGPMASAVSTMKLAKIVNQDFSVQASIRDVTMNCRLVAAAARGADFDAPLLHQSLRLFDRALRSGHGDEDMVAVLAAFDDEEDGARKIVSGQLDAYAARDLDRFMSFWSEDATITLLPDTQFARGSAEIRDFHRRRFDDPSLRVTLVSRTVVGDVVVDHEWVTRSGDDGLEQVEVIALYVVRDELISHAYFRQVQRSAPVEIEAA